MSRHNASQHPVSLLDTVWRPGIVLRPDGKPMTAPTLGKNEVHKLANKKTKHQPSRPVPGEATPVSNYQPHAGKRH